MRLVTKDGSAPRGTRASIMRSDVDSGVPGGYPRVEYEAWPGIPSPCRKSSRRGDGVTSFVSLCSLPRDPNSRAVWIFDPRGLWPDSTNHHVGIVWAFCVVYFSRSLIDVSKERRALNWTGDATAV